MLRVAVARRLAALAAGAPRAETTADAADAVRPLIAAHRRVFPGADAGLLRRAYAVADHWHSGQVRKSGAPYITHPLAVAILLADIGMDTTTLVAALLHDTVEDTGLTIGQVKAEFGAEVAVLVDGVTKLDGSKWGDHAEGETFRKMILAASIDLRVLVIKLADRVHNLRTLGHHPKREKRERIARASMELLVPFAQRLGLYDYQREMEDLAFATLSPEAHARVAALARQTEATERRPRRADHRDAHPVGRGRSVPRWRPARGTSTPFTAACQEGAAAGSPARADPAGGDAAAAAPLRPIERRGWSSGPKGQRATATSRSARCTAAAPGRRPVLITSACPIL